MYLGSDIHKGHAQVAVIDETGEIAEEVRVLNANLFDLAQRYPGASDCTVPWWWAADRDNLRLRAEKIVEQRTAYTLETVDHGQVVTYRGDRTVETAKNGL